MPVENNCRKIFFSLSQALFTGVESNFPNLVKYYLTVQLILVETPFFALYDGLPFGTKNDVMPQAFCNVNESVCGEYQ